ncbi:ANTAR domain-containing protein [Streptomyces hawaiiensis]|uniref:ANTAR domain-containing protein n=1 Tax=Streptomyces hawaiiensis TaxID=67305 RepID=UPI0036604F1F
MDSGAPVAQRITDEAFGILRSSSQHRNIKLRDLCTELIPNLTGRPTTTPALRPHA